jgi:hypothetical protein
MVIQEKRRGEYKRLYITLEVRIMGELEKEKLDCTLSVR